VIAVDTSALIAILLAEPEAEALIARMLGEDRVLVGAPTAFETRLVVARKLKPASSADVLLGAPEIEVVPWTARHVPVAADALRRFGGRPARLNYGDCMAYAVARVAGCPLLFKGDDFAGTDVEPALPGR
jgi:ribonuclease VapC